MTKCDTIKHLKLSDYQQWIKGTFVDDMFTAVAANKRLDQKGEIKDVELVLCDNKTGKETSIFLTDFSCSDGLLEGEWREYVTYLVGGEKVYNKKSWDYFMQEFDVDSYASMYGDNDLNA